MQFFGNVLRERSVAPLVGSQLVARLPNGMLSLAALIHVEQMLHEYRQAGFTIAVFCAGAAIAGPLAGRWLARFGMRRVLGVFMLVDTLCIVAFGFVDGPLWAFLVLSFLAGFFAPPVQSAVRTVYPKLVPARRLQDLFSLDAAAQELIWVFGPVLVTLSASAASTRVALWLTAALGAAGGAWLLLTPVMGQVTVPPSTHRMGAVMRKWPILIAVVSSALIVAAFGANETAVVAAFQRQGATTGVLLAVLSVASAVAGVVSSRMAMAPWSMGTRSAVVGLGVLMAAFAPHNVWWVGAAQIVAGIGSAPSLAVFFANVSSSLKFADTAEAFAWVGTGQLVGSGIGSALAGVLIDTWGPGWAFGMGGIMALLGAGLALAAIPVLPDLRRHSGPLTDTSAVPVIHRPRP